MVKIENAALATTKTIYLQGKHIINIAGNQILNLKEIITEISRILNKNPKIITTEKESLSLAGDITDQKD